MHAVIFRGVGRPLDYTTVPEPTPNAHQVVVTLKAAGLNHRDVFITQGLYPGLVPDCILGSDGAGVVGDRAVLINPNIDWGDDAAAPSKKYRVLGMPDPGTFAERIAVDPSRLVDMPPHLDWKEAAALPLGGLTAYRAVFTKGQCRTGQRVLITGIGGGVALLAFQMALAAEAQVCVTSGSDHKLERAAELGAIASANYRRENWAKELRNQVGLFDLIIDSAGGEGFNELVRLAAPGGRIVFYGGTQGPVPKFKLQPVFWRQLHLLGTSMGTDEEFKDMVRFVGEKQIHPIVDEVFPLSRAQVAFDRMDQGMQFGKIVFDINDA